MTDLFQEEAPQQEQPTQEPSAPQAPESNQLFQEELAAITNFDGQPKYADVPTALKSVQHAEDTIKALREENQSMKEKLQVQEGVKEVIQNLQPAQQPAPEQPSGESVSAEQIAAIVKAQLDEANQLTAAQQQANTQAANLKKVKEALVASYGEKAPEIFAKRAEELGTDKDRLADYAKSDPDFVLKQFDTKPAEPTNPVHGGVNTNAIKPTPAELKPVIYGTAKEMVASYKQHGGG